MAEQPNSLKFKGLYAGNRYPEKIQSVHFEIKTETQYRKLQVWFACEVNALRKRRER